MQQRDQTAGDYRDSIEGLARLALWTLAWGATLALARFGPGSLWDAQPAVSWTAVAANLGAGVGWIVAHARYLRVIDELQRTIMLNALAVTLGVGWVAGFAYVVADAAGLVAREVEVGVFAALLGVVYVLSIGVGGLRYR